MIFLLLLLAGNMQAVEEVRVYDHNRIVEITVPVGMGDYFVSACLKYNVPVEYAYRLIEYESKWNRYAVNENSDGTSDAGLMQLNSAFLDDFSWRYNKGVPINPFDWKVNLDVGLHHLSVLRKHTGSWYNAVAAYNMGLTAFRTKKIYVTTRRQLDYVFQN